MRAPRHIHPVLQLSSSRCARLLCLRHTGCGASAPGLSGSPLSLENYLPIELYELIKNHVTTVKAVVFIVNIGIVAYMIYVHRYRAVDQDEPKAA